MSGIFSAGDGFGESTAIRYAPLRNEKYLLTWVMRHPVAYAQGQRAWHTEVHFLMDAQDADSLFCHPISAVAEAVGTKAYEMWKNMKCELDGGLNFFGKDERPRDNWDANGKIDDCILLAGAFYCGRANGAYQLFLESEDPWGEMDVVQRCLPYALRKDLSFCVGLQSQQESEGTVFNFPTDIGLQQLYSAHGEGVPMSEKYWNWDTFGDQKLYSDCNRILGRLNEWPETLLGTLFSTVTQWNELKAFAEDNLTEGLNNVIMYTGQEIWCRQLRNRQIKPQDLEWLLGQIRDNKNTKTLQKEIKRKLRVSVPGRFAGSKNKQSQNNASGDQTDELLLKQFLLDRALRGAAAIAMVVVVVVFLTLFRQVLVRETVEVEQMIYYCISREAAVDAMKLVGSFLCGAATVLSVLVLIGTFKRKK